MVIPYAVSHMSELAHTILAARRRARISQRELAIRASTSQSSISRIESGLEEPSFDRFSHLMGVMGYKPRLEFEPIAVHDAEPRRILEQADKTAQQRFEEGVNWMRFVRSIRPVAADE